MYTINIESLTGVNLQSDAHPSKIREAATKAGHDLSRIPLDFIIENYSLYDAQTILSLCEKDGWDASSRFAVWNAYQVAHFFEEVYPKDTRLADALEEGVKALKYATRENLDILYSKIKLLDTLDKSTYADYSEFKLEKYAKALNALRCVHGTLESILSHRRPVTVAATYAGLCHYGNEAFETKQKQKLLEFVRCSHKTYYQPKHGAMMQCEMVGPGQYGNTPIVRFKLKMNPYQQGTVYTNFLTESEGKLWYKVGQAFYVGNDTYEVFIPTMDIDKSVKIQIHKDEIVFDNQILKEVNHEAG